MAASGLVFGRMREDPALEARLVAEVAKRRARPVRVGLVAGAGDTALSLLALETVGAIEAIDESAAQLQLVELKRGAIAGLPLADQLALIGAAPGTPEMRLALYARLAPWLPEATRRFWDQAPDAVAFGLARAGSEDRRWAALATALAARGLDPVAHPREALLDGGWRDDFEAAFGEAGGALAEAYARVLWHELPQENYLLMQAWRESYDPARGQAPPYLLPEHQEAMRSLGLERLSLHEGALLPALEALGPFDLISLSTTIDDVPTANLPAVLDRLRRVLARGGALLVRRMQGLTPIAPVTSEHLRLDATLSEYLARIDRAVATREVIAAFA